MEKIELMKVEFMPMSLDAGILYVSEKYRVAAHLCPCGCGSKIVTPLGPTEWYFTEDDQKATLYPSMGNWQLPCRSHYWIVDGEIEWSYAWSDDQIQEGREKEEVYRRFYYDLLERIRRAKRDAS